MASKKRSRPKQPGGVEPLYTLEEVAQALKVSVMTVRRLIWRGELKEIRLGGQIVRVPLRSINALIEKASRKSAGKPKRKRK